MKITDLKTLVVNAVMRNWVFVKVETGQPGLYGRGEATLGWKTRAVVGCIEDFKPMVVGQDPTRIEFLWADHVPPILSARGDCRDRHVGH